MAATLGFPFTAAQWKELERQAIIYKYMVASVPVPPDLLLPFTRSVSTPLGGGGGSVINLRYSSNKDPEPGRCKRTDGKKWRCSRAVAPNQKYCERHMHRGRPRSRKPVEVHPSSSLTNKRKTSLDHTPLPTTLQTNVTSSQLVGSTFPTNDTPNLFFDKAYLNIHSPTRNEPKRGLDWIESEMVEMDPLAQQWQDFMQTNISLTNEGSVYDTNASAFQQHYGVEPINLITYTDFGGSIENQQNLESNLFINPDLVSKDEQPQIDSWVGQTPGGPLAEALRLTTVTTGSNPASPYNVNGDTSSPPATTVSSPSGVLHRTMVSLSDSSGCNSPTLAASTATPDFRSAYFGYF